MRLVRLLIDSEIDNEKQMEQLEEWVRLGKDLGALTRVTTLVVDEESSLNTQTFEQIPTL